MSNLWRKCLLGLLVISFPLLISAQVNDAGIWLEAGLEKKITRVFAVDLTQGMRWNENITELGSTYTEAGVSYKFARRLTFAAHYRFTQKLKKENYYSMRHRYHADISYKLKIKKLNLIFRERFQSTYKDIARSEAGGVPENYLRSKLTFKYDLNRRYTPFVSGEISYQLGQYIDKLRFKAGIDYEFSKYSALNIYYMINKEIQVKNPWTSYVIGAGYTYSF